MGTNFVDFNYTVKNKDLLGPCSDFWADFLELCQKYDKDFPKFSDKLEITAEVGKVVEWKVHAFEVRGSIG